MQIKAYAKWQGKPESWDSSDRGETIFRTICQDYTVDLQPDNYDHYLTKLLKAGYILELVFVFALVLKFVPGYYLALSERVHCNRSFYSIYWGTAFIVSLINLCLLITHLSIY